MLLEPLAPGDIVDVIAPASKCDPGELKKGLTAIRALGLTPRISKRIFAKSLLFSNSDEERLQQLKNAVYARDSKMIWCVRGGYGALRLMPSIEKWKKPSHAKIFVGFSDITTLHAHFNQKWNWPTLHGPMVGALGRGALKVTERKELLDLIFARQTEVHFKNLQPLNRAARVARTLKAPIVGGNMIVLQSGLGTPSSLNPKARLVFFEDTGERPHRVDRMLAQFEQTGWFKHCKGVLLGDFLVKDPEDQRGLWRDVFPRFAERLSIPVVAGMPVGHKEGAQRTLPLNTLATLKLGSRPSLSVTSGIVKR